MRAILTMLLFSVLSLSVFATERVQDNLFHSVKLFNDATLLALENTEKNRSGFSLSSFEVGPSISASIGIANVLEVSSSVGFTLVFEREGN